MAMIEVKRLSKKFKRLWAVKDVSFEVKEGEIFGFLGPNGAGKTTTIKMLTTLLKPDRGTAKIQGYDVRIDKKDVRAVIGIIFQDPSLDIKLTAEENLKFHAWLYDVKRKDFKGRMEEMLKMVKLYDRRKGVVETYSGGMKRRLEIARGLLHYPKVLFLDEPTIGLDPQTRNKIWDYILDLRRKKNITMFLTTHYMEEAECCDRIAVMDQGKIIALNSPEGLKQRIGGDIITLKTEDNEKARTELLDKFRTNSKIEKNAIVIHRENGQRFAPEIIRNLSVKVLSVNIRRPTLNDVFLALTGKEFRDELNGKEDTLKHKLKLSHRATSQYQY